METNRGAPTPPIAFAGNAADVRDRLTPPRVEVDEQLRDRLADTGATVSTGAAESGEGRGAGGPQPRLVAARDDLGARQPGGRARVGDRAAALDRRRRVGAADL